LRNFSQGVSQLAGYLVGLLVSHVDASSSISFQHLTGSYIGNFQK